MADLSKEIVETVREPLLILDSNLVVVRGNRAFYRLFQTNPSETVGHPLAQLAGDRLDGDQLGLLLHEILPEQTTVEDFELKCELPALGLRTMLINARQICGEDFMLLAFEDITDRKLKEEELKELTLRLERSNQELQSFAQVASHDLQEPLRKVMAFGERLRETSEDSLNQEAKDYLSRMLHAASRMSTLINDLLIFSRLETRFRGFTKVDLGNIVSEVLLDLEEMVSRSGATVDVQPGLPVIEADAGQMRQLVQNLLENALKYHRAGVPPHVRICGDLSGHGESPAISAVRLTVEDNGIGFEDKYQERIFGLFQRLHSWNEYPGTGMGLALAQKIVVWHKGAITAKGVPGAGATFNVTLPLSQTNSTPHQ